MKLTNALIEGTIDSITGFIAARAAEELNRPLADVMEIFLLSNTYQLLSDIETGYYWDSLPELYAMFLKEAALTGVAG